MRARVEFTDNSPKFLRALKRAKRFGLAAAARVLVREVKRRLRGGYTSGDFVTGNVQNSVTYLEPYEVGNGDYETLVGTNVDYALFWELGHNNIFTRKPEHEPVWIPAIQEVEGELSQAYSDKVRQVITEAMA